MATLVLGTAGNFVGGPILGFVGAAIGAYIDQRFLAPLLSDQSPIEGARLDDRQVQLASEGSPANWVIGPLNRVAGTVIWSTDLIETESEEDVGGKAGGSSQSVKSYTYSVNCAIAVAVTDTLPGGKINRIPKIWADAKILMDGEEAPRWDEMRIHLGDQTTADPIMLASVEPGELVPSHNGTVIVSFRGLQLTDFGNRIPSMSFLAEQSVEMSVAGAISLTMQRYGFDPSEFDVTSVSSCFRGISVSGPQQGSTILDVLLATYGIGIQESEGVYRFFQRGQEEIIEVDAGELAAQDGDSRTISRLSITDGSDTQIPQKVNVSFVNTENDLQEGSRTARRIQHRSPNNNLGLSLPVTLTPEEASSIARRVLWASEVERQKYQFTLPPDRLKVQEGDIVRVVVDGVRHSIYVTQITRGANYILEVEGVRAQQSVYFQNGVEQAQVAEGQAGAPIPDTTVVVFDGPPLALDLHNRIGVYFAICNTDRAQAWRGATLYSAVSEASGYLRRADSPGEAVLGTCLVPPLPCVEWLWDDRSGFVVELLGGTLTSCTDQECVEGRNRIAILHPTGDWEIIGFAQVEEISETRYRLTRLIRGLRGTEHLMSGHAGGSKIVVLTDRSIGFWERGASGLGTRDFYKGPAVGDLVSAVPSQRARCNGRTMRPLAPSHLDARREPGDRDSWFTATVADFALSGSSYAGPAGAFYFLTPGDIVTVSGFATGGNNGSFEVASVSSDGGTLEIVGTTTAEAGSPNVVTFVKGHPDDIVVKFRRRSKQLTGVYTFGPVSADEAPSTHAVEFRAGGLNESPLRTIFTQEEKAIYTKQMQDEDGVSLTDYLSVTVQQISTSVGRSVRAITAINGRIAPPHFVDYECCEPPPLPLLLSDAPIVPLVADFDFSPAAAAQNSGIHTGIFD
jgi:hypothetical protein